MPKRKDEIKVLYLGLDLPLTNIPEGEIWIHHPLIEVIPRSPASVSFEIVKNHLDDYTHIIFTSKSAVKIFKELISPKSIFATIIAVGQSTADEIKKSGWPTPFTPRRETAEGIIELLNALDLSQAFVLWPHSSLSRPILYDYFVKKDIRFHHPVFYDTRTLFPEELVDLHDFDVVYFTSPSTVDAFFEVYGKPPLHLKLRAIGEVTENYLHSRLAKF